MSGTMYVLERRERRLYRDVKEAAVDLPGQLKALMMLGEAYSPESKEVVRGALFRSHGWGPDGTRPEAQT